MTVGWGLPPGLKHRLSALVVVGVTVMVSPVGVKAHLRARELITESGTELLEHATVPSFYFLHHLPTPGCQDYPTTAPEVAVPADGSPWGVHVGPVQPHGTYVISWLMGNPVVGPPLDRRGSMWVPADADAPSSSGDPSFQPHADAAEVDPEVGVVELTPRNQPTAPPIRFMSHAIVYKRQYESDSYRNYSYMSARIHHARVEGLQPGVAYTYRVGGVHGPLSRSFNFTTLPLAGTGAEYPFRFGLMGDVGQTHNSSDTMRYMRQHSPQAILNVGDLSYADTYNPKQPENSFAWGTGTNQRRWDTFAVLAEPLLSSVPTLHAIGNHEVEHDGINALLTPQTEIFSFPENYPFQSFSARYPGPVQSPFGDITSNLYYSTNLGPAHVVVMNNYVPMHPGTRQYQWFVNDMETVNRSLTPWLIVVTHAPPYHSYYNHYKEMDCFLEIYEELFYKFGVDLVLSGHVHAYERTHPTFWYGVDTCAPAYIVIGDGGNVEGLYRNFVDDTDPSTNKTYCEKMTNPNALSKDGQGPYIQRRIQPPDCNTVTFQLPYVYSDVASTTGRVQPATMGLVPSATNNSVYWCQRSQPRWSAYRDPSFGLATLDIESESVAHLKWFRNADGGQVEVDATTYERLSSCAGTQHNTARRPWESTSGPGNQFGDDANGAHGAEDSNGRRGVPSGVLVKLVLIELSALLLLFLLLSLVVMLQYVGVLAFRKEITGSSAIEFQPIILDTGETSAGV